MNLRMNIQNQRMLDQEEKESENSWESKKYLSKLRSK